MSVTTASKTQTQTQKVDKHPYSQFGIFNLEQFTDEEFDQFMKEIVVEFPEKQNSSAVKIMNISHCKVDPVSKKERKRRLRFVLPEARLPFGASRYVPKGGSIDPPKKLSEFKVQVRLDIRNNLSHKIVYDRLRMLNSKIVEFVLANKDEFKLGKKINNEEDCYDYCDISYIVEEQNKINEKTDLPYDPLLSMKLMDNIVRDDVVGGTVVWDNSPSPKRLMFPDPIDDDNILEVIPKNCNCESIIDLGSGYIVGKNKTGFSRKLSQLRIKEVSDGVGSNMYKEIFYNHSPFETTTVSTPTTVTTMTTTNGDEDGDEDETDSTGSGLSAHEQEEFLSQNQAQEPMSLSQTENYTEDSDAEGETHEGETHEEPEFEREKTPEPEPEPVEVKVPEAPKKKVTRKPRTTKAK